MPAPLTGDALALRLLYAAWAVANGSGALGEAIGGLLEEFGPSAYAYSEDVHQEATAEEVAAWLTTGSTEGM